MNELEIPTCISVESWKAYVEMRRKKGQRAPLTDYAATLIWAELLKADKQGYDAQHMLNKAIVGGWSDVYLRPDTPKKSRAAEETKRMLDERTEQRTSGPSPEVKARLLAAAGKAIRRVA